MRFEGYFLIIVTRDLYVRRPAMIDIINKCECTGCQMCEDICPVEAISFFPDECGFWYPKVDYQKCVKCQKCINTCPSLNSMKNENYNNPIVFAGWAKNKNIRLSSTSGGAYYVFAKDFLEKNGIIAGCVYSKDYKSAYHTLGFDESDLIKIMGSKYFQSNSSGIYKDIKIQLSEGKKVLFCGAPCQSAALYSFVGNHPNLYTVDFICRGVNSPKAYRAYIEEQEKKANATVSKVHLKDKRKGWQSLATYMQFSNGKEYYKYRYNDWWIKGYIQGNLFMREACHHCKYKNIPRVSDITIGDFWGIDGLSDEDMFNGVSAIILNSCKGKELLNNVKDSLVLNRMSLDDVSNGNPCLLNIAKKGKNRDNFFKDLDEMPFSKAVKSNYDGTFKEEIKNILKTIRKEIFKSKKW